MERSLKRARSSLELEDGVSDHTDTNDMNEEQNNMLLSRSPSKAAGVTSRSSTNGQSINGKYHSQNEMMSSVSSCVMYVSCSTVMVLANKWLASSFKIEAHISLLLMQNAVATVLVSACKTIGIVSYPNFERRIALKWLPVNLYFVLMLLTSFAAMRFLSVPMITVFKQLANLLTVTGEYYFFNKSITFGVLLSFLVMILGAALAANNDLAFDAKGYFWQMANCVSTSAYVLQLKFATKTVQLSRFAMVFYNNLLSLPLLALVAIIKGEPQHLIEAHRNGLLDARFFALNAFAGSIGFLLNLASVWCVAATSATTYAVTGALNKVPTTILGYFYFHTPISRELALYISLSLTGGFMYTYEKLRQLRRIPSSASLVASANANSLNLNTNTLLGGSGGTTTNIR